MSTEPNADQAPVIEVCFGPQCSDCGGRRLAGELQVLGLKYVEGDCRDQCPNAPLVLVDKRMITHATARKVEDRLRDMHEE